MEWLLAHVETRGPPPFTFINIDRLLLLLLLLLLQREDQLVQVA